jgi:CheY-like chemotaxis protein
MRALRKVLVVDDDPVIARSFDRVLTEKGYEVASASSGREALDRIVREDYDVIYTDIRMPGMDGIEVAERVKSRRPWVPVVIITGYGTDANEARAEAAGVSDFLRKPLSPEMIEASAAKALDGAEARQAPVETVPEPAAPASARAEGNASLPRALGMLVAAPLIGLVYAVAFPFAGLAVLGYLGADALLKRSGRILLFFKNVLLFFAAPFIGLAYVLAFPFVGLGVLAWMGARALKRNGTR